jgi:adenylosuccinate synthase
MRLIVLSGPIGVGKTSFGNATIDLFGATRVSTRSWLIAKTNCPNERSALQSAGDKMDAETGGAWVADAVENATRAGDGSLLLLDSARIEGQIRALRDRFGGDVFHVHLNAHIAELERRYIARKSELKEFATYAEARSHDTEAQVETLAAIADVVLDADHSGPETLASTAMAIVGQKGRRA